MFSSICLTLLFILLIFPFALKWYFTKYLPAWDDVIDIIRSAGKGDSSKGDISK